MFTQILTAGVLAGIFSGLLLSALQQIEMAPLLRAAEVREDAAAAASVASSAAVHAPGSAGATPEHLHAAGAPSHRAWAPGTSGVRLLSTGVANIVLATGFALMLGALFALRGTRGWRTGLASGVAGYLVFFVAPSLGLPPELPGSESAPLPARELWWSATVAASAAGLALIAFGKRLPLRVLGALLLVAPHVIGAPQHSPRAAIHPAEAVTAFISATFIVNAAFWLVLGGFSGLLARARR